MNIYYVYTHTFNNGTKYVGKGKLYRAYSRAGRNKYWKRLYSKYGKPVIQILRQYLTEKEAFDIEMMVISVYKETDIQVCNITDGGEGTSGLKGSKAYWYGKTRCNATRTKISNKIKGINHTNYGNNLSDTTKKKISLATKGKVVSDKTKELLRIRAYELNRVGDRNPAYSSKKFLFSHTEHGEVFCTQYELYTKYDLIKSCVCLLVQGKQKSHKGWYLKDSF